MDNDLLDFIKWNRVISWQNLWKNGPLRWSELVALESALHFENCGRNLSFGMLNDCAILPWET